MLFVSTINQINLRFNHIPAFPNIHGGVLENAIYNVCLVFTMIIELIADETGII
jgi:hypothetical protein